MKIAFYIDPYVCFSSVIYIIEILINEFNKMGHILNIYIPINTKCDDNIADCYINSKNCDFVYWTFPDVNNYDALFVTHVWHKGWGNKMDMRKEIVKPFIKQHKKVLSLKIDSTIEHRYINNEVYYGVSNLLHLNLPKRWILPINANKFVSNHIANFSFEKPNSLTKEDFYNKYNIDISDKIIVFMVPAFRKWKDTHEKFTRAIHIFFKKYKSIVKILKRLNYTLVLKLHRYNGNKIIEKYNLHHMKIINNEDTYELIKYSDKAITFGSIIVYELYLYNLPVFELGNGVYYPGWLSARARDNINNSPLHRWNNGRDLIFGHILSSYKKILIELPKFIKTKYNINKYPYKYNHPIFGNSYGTSMMDVVNNLTNMLNKN
jgi:hypothetical protein